MTTQNKKRGRKPFDLEWPSGTFTVNSVLTDLNKPLSKVSIYTKINKALNAGQLTLVKRTKSSIGRPEAIYMKTVDVKNTETVDFQNENQS